MNPATEQAYQQIIQQQQARIAELEKKVEVLLAQVATLTSELARARKNSSNSSKPPSSDITKPPKPPPVGGGKRHIGGQPGHQRHERTPFPPDQIDQIKDYRPNRCPDCGTRLRTLKRPAPRRRPC